MSAVVYLWDPKNDLGTYVDCRRQGWFVSGTSILFKTELKLAEGRRAIQFEIQDVEGLTSLVLFTEVGDRFLEISGNRTPTPDVSS